MSPGRRGQGASFFPGVNELRDVARYRSVHALSVADAAYLAGLIDGEGTITLGRKHATDGRQLTISISNTERAILEFALRPIGAGKITAKRSAKAHHAPAFTYAVWNRQALSLLAQVAPFLRSYKRYRAALVLDNYVRLTPRNGKYTPALLSARQRFESEVLSLRASPSSTPGMLKQR
jgi:hypothetical protein